MPAHQIRIEVDEAPRSLTIFECRPPWRPDFGPEWTRLPVARLRWTGTRQAWDLLYAGTSDFHGIGLSAPLGMVGRLLVEIGRIDIFTG